MLKLAGIASKRGGSRTVGGDIPFDVEFAPEVASIDDLFYWRCTNGRHLLEVKIVSSTGMIGGVSLVLVPLEWSRLVQSVQTRPIPSDEGLPIVDCSPWKAKTGNREFVDPGLRFIDEKIPLLFHIGVDGICVSFNSGEAASVVRNGDVAFSFTNDGFLCAITLMEVSGRELQLLRREYAR